MEIYLDEPNETIAPEEIETTEETRQIPLGLGSILTAMFLDNTATDEMIHDKQKTDELEMLEDQVDALDAEAEPVDAPLEDLEEIINKEDYVAVGGCGGGKCG